MWPTSSHYKSVIAAKRTQRQNLLDSAPAYLSSSHDTYLNATASQIVTRIGNGEWTASDVIEAYIARAAFAQATTNCVTEVLFEEARLHAQELDKEFATTKQLRGPLHGVPVSFKDQFEIVGVDATTGFSQWANQPGPRDADLVAIFRAAGAIIIVKTNVPQTMLAFECSNPLWGRTTNPWNDKYTCGGSTGGEGALLAMDGSVIGLGSDVGGSLRIPAAYCGLYSIKPTVGRIAHRGARSPAPGFDPIKTVVGPMARSLADVEMACRIMFGIQSAEHDIAPVPYRDVSLPEKLRFGYYTSDCYIKASPACKRAVLETVEALRKQGHECIEFDLPDPARAFDIFVGLTSSDGYKTLRSHLGPDPQESSLFLVTLGPTLPGFLRRFVAWIAESFLSDKLFATTMRMSRVKPFREVMELAEQRDKFAEFWHEQVWAKFKFDGIIAPVQALPALHHGGCANLSPLAAATILYNIVDSPAGCIPVTRVDPIKDKLTDEWTVGPGLGSPILEGALYRGKNPAYDPEAMNGMPVGVQVVGRRWEDEKVFAMMHVIDQALGFRGFGPLSWHSGLKG
jgi:amidase